MRILVEISTKNRDSILGRCLAALHQQSCQDFDVLILNDGDEPIGKTQTTEYILGELGRAHAVAVMDGSHISQAHNHNVPLYLSRFYDFIVRLDDDILLNRRAVEYMCETIQGDGVVAVGGLWFENAWDSDEFHDRAMPEDLSHPLFSGRISDVNSNWQQRVYHPTNEPYEVQHIYSACLYDTEAMRFAGGWPEVYSKGVAHGEETDGTYRLHLAGGRLLIDPRVTGQHLRSPGGIRDVADLNQSLGMDREKWRNRLPELDAIDFFPTVAVESAHVSGVGGAERLFYHTVHLLQSRTGLDVYPIFSGLYHSPERCKELFGFSYEERKPLGSYDVLITIGHDIKSTTYAKRKIMYCLFPLEAEPQDRILFTEYDLILGISEYTAEHIGEIWGYEAEYLYPPVVPIGHGGVEKENIILIVSRCVPYKAPLWLMERFIEAGDLFMNWELHVVAATSEDEAFEDYEEQVLDFASQHDSIVVHRNINHGRLANLYRRAKILWSANGLVGTKPSGAEHFGYTPVEAWSAGCVPLVYDRGGHKETVNKPYRWITPDELIYSTKDAIVSWARGHSWMANPPVDIQKFFSEFADGDYTWRLEQYIRRVNAMSLELVPVVEEDISVTTRVIRVAAISDSPRLRADRGLSTGFGMVAGQIYKHIAKQDDMELCVFGMMDTDKLRPGEELPWSFYESPFGDLQAIKRDSKVLPHFIKWAEWREPIDVIFEIYEPGNAYGHLMTLRSLGIDQPVVLYFPIEGLPPHNLVYDLAGKVEYPVVFCQSGIDHVKEQIPQSPITYAYLGVDHAPFAPLDPKERERWRKLVGWDDKFVVINVGSNKRGKQQPYLIEAMRILLEWGHDDVYLYLHTRKYDRNVMNGWALDWICDRASFIHGLPVSEHVLFPPAYDKWRGIPYRHEKPIEAWRLTMPPTPQARGVIFSLLDMITLYGIADLYVDVSSVEGFNLPPLEAVACGTPTISVDDGHVRTEVHSKYCYDMLYPRHWDVWHTSATLQLVDPVDVARAILNAKENYEDARAQALDASKRVTQDLPWETTAQYFVDLIRKAAYG